MGLLAKVLPIDELRPFVLRQAAKLLALPASSVRATKQLMKAGGNGAGCPLTLGRRATRRMQFPHDT